MASPIPDTQEYVDIPSLSDEHEQVEEEKEVDVGVVEPGSSRNEGPASVPDKDKDKDNDCEVSTVQIVSACTVWNIFTSSW